MKVLVYFKNKGTGEYVESTTPVSFTTDVTKASCIILDLDNIEDELENIANVISELLKYDISMEIMLEMLDEASKDKICIMIIKETGIFKTVNPALSKENADAINEFANELAEYVAEEYLKGAASGMMSSISKTISDISKAMGRGSGKISATGSTDVDKIIEAINNETKGHVSKPVVTLTDYVSGPILAKELEEIKDFMENYKDYKDLNVEIPMGILLKGEPGTGKTYAAKCIAGSTDCYFISCTASSLQGMYIGSGSQNIRELFSGAKALQSASGKGVIIFIDEIDSLGSRDSHRGGAGGEEDRTVNQLLAEMDGFEDTDQIMVMAATNYAERLDDALTRSGRFSRQITIPYPKEKERKWLLDFYFGRLKLNIADTDTDNVTLLTHGLSPADIKEITNESAILAIRNKRKEILLEDINEAINKCITKNVRNEDDKSSLDLVTAHECGHVLAEHLYLNETSVKVTNYSYGDAGGFTQASYRLEGIIPKDKFIDYIKVLLAGRAAEEVCMGYVTNGASNDLQRALHIMTRYYDTYQFELYKAGDLEDIVIENINNIYKEVVEDFIKNKDKLETLINELKSKRVLYKLDLTAILGVKGGGIL